MTIGNYSMLIKFVILFEKLPPFIMESNVKPNKIFDILPITDIKPNQVSMLAKMLNLVNKAILSMKPIGITTHNANIRYIKLPASYSLAASENTKLKNSTKKIRYAIPFPIW